MGWGPGAHQKAATGPGPLDELGLIQGCGPPSRPSRTLIRGSEGDGSRRTGRPAAAMSSHPPRTVSQRGRRAAPAAAEKFMRET